MEKMEYRIIDESISKKNTTYWYTTMVIVYILILFFALWPIIWPSSNTYFNYYVSATMFGIFVGTLVYFYLHNKKMQQNKSIMHEHALEVNIGNDGITLMGKSEKKFYSYSYFSSQNIQVIVKSSNRLTPRPKSFKFTDFLEQGFDYLRKELSGVPLNKRDKIILSLEFWIRENTFSGGKLLFVLLVSLSILPLSSLEKMIEEWREKFEAYLKKVEDAKK